MLISYLVTLYSLIPVSLGLISAIKLQLCVNIDLIFSKRSFKTYQKIVATRNVDCSRMVAKLCFLTAQRANRGDMSFAVCLTVGLSVTLSLSHLLSLCFFTFLCLFVSLSVSMALSLSHFICLLIQIREFFFVSLFTSFQSYFTIHSHKRTEYSLQTRTSQSLSIFFLFVTFNLVNLSN